MRTAARMRRGDCGRARRRSCRSTGLAVGALIGLLMLPGAAWARSYSTTFSTSESPLSENGAWIDGLVTGLDWSSVQVSPAGLAHGTQSGVATGNALFGDSTSVLAGTWGPDQTASAVVHATNQQPGSGNIFEEVELRLRTTITAHSITGYECNYAARTVNPYVQIVRWDGAQGSFAVLDSRGGPGLHDGDVVKCSISGSTITTYINDVEIFSVTDTTFTSGSPGIGFFFQDDGSDTPLSTDFGFTSFTATDGVGPTPNKTFTVPPCRIVDTRVAGGVIPGNTSRSFLAAGALSGQGGASNCNIPRGAAKGVYLNVVAVWPSGPGYLTMYPASSEQPLASTLNFGAGQTIANGVLVPICDPTMGSCPFDITVYMGQSSSHVVIDVSGYVGPKQ